eukprot:SAG22_NODE_1541_length_4174_cov_3.161227_1_plen_106_part_00
MIGRWRSLPPIPTRDGVDGRRLSCACVALPAEDCVAVLGGHGVDGVALKRCDKFNLRCVRACLPACLPAAGGHQYPDAFGSVARVAAHNHCIHSDRDYIVNFADS